MWKMLFAMLIMGAMIMGSETPVGNKAVEGNNALSGALYGELAKTEQGNLFFSPVSIHMALGMTYAGARGKTADQMARVLGLESAGAGVFDAYSDLIGALHASAEVQRKALPGGGDERMIVANALWGQKGYPWKEDFLRTLDGRFGAGLRQVDFKRMPEDARAEINRWVEQQTRDKIRDLLQPGTVTAVTRLVLTNAAYFKDHWLEPFQDSQTREEPFHLAGGGEVQTPLMHHTARFGYQEAAGWKALEMTYGAGDFSMVVFLPNEPSGLASLEQAWAAGSLPGRLDAFGVSEVVVTLPKFTATGEFSLSKTLARLGMADAFKPSADFSGMTAAEGVFIDDVVHKAFVNVDEKGTEAAAATAVTMRVTSIMKNKPQPKEFKADHPFLFLIRHRPTGAVLFLGRLMRP